MKSRILIKTEASPKIGWGHMMRMIALADMLRLQYEILFVSNSKVDLKYRILALSDKEFLEQINSKDIVILDGYEYTISFQRRIKDRGARLVCIDDYQHTNYYADLIINPAPGVTESQIGGQDYTKHLLGPNYSLLRIPFLEKFSRSFKNHLSSIFICFGGTDPMDLTTRYVELFLDNRADLIEEVNVVLGLSYSGRVQNLKSKKLKTHKSLNSFEIRDLLRGCDLAVTSASTILFEALSQKTPTIAGYYVDNQISIYNGFVKMGAIEGIGDLTQSKVSLGEEFFNGYYWKRRLDLLNDIFDGKNGERIVTAFKEL